MATDFVTYRLSNAEYHRILDSGALANSPVELLDGHLAHMSPQGEEHALIIRVLIMLLGARPELLHVQGPLEVEEGWIPEPDLALTPIPDAGFSTSAHLAVEVAVSMHREARAKARAYARADIPRYWIVDVPGRVVIEHTEPGPDGYAASRELRGDDVLDPHVDGLAPFAVARVFERLSES